MSTYYDKDKFKRKSIKDAVEDFKEYKKRLDAGDITMIKTCYQSINNMGHDGFHPGTINCIAGHSGTGKTTLLNNIITTIPKFNKNTRVLMLSLEMPSRSLVARNLSRFSRNTVKDITINKKYEELDHTILEKLEKLPIDYIEIAGDATETATNIAGYLSEYKDWSVFVALDHSLLIEGNDDASKIAELVNHFNILRKKFPNSTYLILSQLNDAMQEKDRIYQRIKMYPSYTDLYQGRKLYHICDTVIVLNKPSTYLSDTTYGNQNLPLYFDSKDLLGNPIKIPIIYAHCIKGRDSGTQIAAFADNLHFNEFEELDISKLAKPSNITTKSTTTKKTKKTSSSEGYLNFD